MGERLSNRRTKSLRMRYGSTNSIMMRLLYDNNEGENHGRNIRASRVNHILIEAGLSVMCFHILSSV
ncbi:hypothetical protein Pfo_014569 [Paulownia fortunei]|nr:hypothetical protein Pfo_014569 [Paulownia fortunei]